MPRQIPPYNASLSETQPVLVSRVWRRFFELLGDAANTIIPGSITNADLADMAAGTVKGRPFDVGTGEPQDLLLDAAQFYTTGTGPYTLHINGENLDGYWSILTNGDPVTPEIVFDGDGDVISVWMTD